MEYCGALVRCTVADAAERRLYNSLVGAGTYVFRLSDSLCVDATRAGARRPGPPRRPRGRAWRCGAPACKSGRICVENLFYFFI